MELVVKYTFVEELGEDIQSFEEKTDIVEIPDDVFANEVMFDDWLNKSYPVWVEGGDENHKLTYGCHCPVVKDMDGHVILIRRDPKLK